jgi:hypothetical protein
VELGGTEVEGGRGRERVTEGFAEFDHCTVTTDRFGRVRSLLDDLIFVIGDARC